MINWILNKLDSLCSWYRNKRNNSSIAREAKLREIVAKEMRAWCQENSSILEQPAPLGIVPLGSPMVPQPGYCLGSLRKGELVTTYACKDSCKFDVKTFARGLKNK